ncbi:MAG: cold shock domain-containing protein [Chloroflexia bacterium]|jgi:CspA family cold shock protein|nr:cold shock domain-containing protein [Chloroflexia bacterium]MBA3274907.1 cold shock domain-containing protein [Chloroflexia bacterium]
MPTGTVKWYNPEKGFGFIERDGGEEDLFVHRSAVGYQTLGEGDRVEFTVGMGPKGPAADSVTVLESNPNPRPQRSADGGNGGGRRGGFESDVDPSSLPLVAGTVDRFDDLKGFGFIKQDNGGADVFFHQSALNGARVYQGDHIEFRLGEGPKGPRAEQIRLLDQ